LLIYKIYGNNRGVSLISCHSQVLPPCAEPQVGAIAESRADQRAVGMLD